MKTETTPIWMKKELKILFPPQPKFRNIATRGLWAMLERALHGCTRDEILDELLGRGHFVER